MRPLLETDLSAPCCMQAEKHLSIFESKPLHTDGEEIAAKSSEAELSKETSSFKPTNALQPRSGLQQKLVLCASIMVSEVELLD